MLLRFLLFVWLSYISGSTWGDHFPGYKHTSRRRYIVYVFFSRPHSSPLILFPFCFIFHSSSLAFLTSCSFVREDYKVLLVLCVIVAMRFRGHHEETKSSWNEAAWSKNSKENSPQNQNCSSRTACNNFFTFEWCISLLIQSFESKGMNPSVTGWTPSFFL